jgi:hypothetical protein
MNNSMNRFLIFCLPLLLPFSMVAQENKEKPAVTYEELYDEPYSVNKLFIGFQPLYGELFATNANAGFGVEASYYYKDKLDFKAHFRKTYSSNFFDFKTTTIDKCIPSLSSVITNVRIVNSNYFHSLIHVYKYKIKLENYY